MKKLIYSAAVIALVFVFSACKGDKGDPGPQGSAGAAGATGPAGAQGPAGPSGANTVVYGNWTNFTAATWSPFSALFISSYNVTGITGITQQILDRGVVKIFIKKTGNANDVFTLPVLDYGNIANDEFYNLDHVTRLNGFTIRCNDLAGAINPVAMLGIFAQYRYVIIPGSVAGRSNELAGGYNIEQVKKMTYAELCAAYHIKP